MKLNLASRDCSDDLSEPRDFAIVGTFFALPIYTLARGRGRTCARFKDSANARALRGTIEKRAAAEECIFLGLSAGEPSDELPVETLWCVCVCVLLTVAIKGYLEF